MRREVLPFPVFRSKYFPSFYYQVISAIPGHLLTKAKSKDLTPENLSYEDPESFRLTENVNINLLKTKSKDFYWLIIHRKYNGQHAGPRRWNKTITEDKTNWGKIFKSVRKVCKENKLREFHFKFIHRVVVTRKELSRFNIKPDSNCVYCGESDSIHHTFNECQFFLNRTLKQRTYRYLTTNNTLNFVPVLQALVKGYNRSYHRSIKMAPNQVTEANSLQVYENLYGKKDEKFKKPTLKVGDRVRLNKKFRTFKKSNLPGWTEEVFVVREARKGQVPTYKLEEWSGTPLEGTMYKKSTSRITTSFALKKL